MLPPAGVPGLASPWAVDPTGCMRDGIKSGTDGIGFDWQNSTDQENTNSRQACFPRLSRLMKMTQKCRHMGFGKEVGKREIWWSGDVFKSTYRLQSCNILLRLREHMTILLKALP